MPQHSTRDIHPRRRIRTAAAALALAALAACSGAEAPVVTPQLVRRDVATYSFYDVEGKDPESIHRSMRSRAPRLDGRTVYGRTDWNVSWRAQWLPEGNGTTCRAANVDVQLRVDVTMPQWTGRATGRRRLANQWDEFIIALAVHEAGHVDIASDAARDVREAIVRVSGPCGQMQARTDAEVERVLRESRRRGWQYDDETYAGMNQGAVWPPREQS